MSTRLQVVVSDEELARYHEVARGKGMTVSEWVRQSLRLAERDVPRSDVARKLAVLDWAKQLHLGPEVDIDQMLAEIELGYQQDLPGLD